MKHKLLVCGLVLTLILVLMGGAVGQAQPVSANGNNAPVYNGGLADQLFNRNYTFSYQFGGTCFSDPDGDALSYSATLADSSPLPAWLNFNGPTRTFSGTTPNTTATLTVTVTAADTYSATATGNFSFTVQGGPPQFHGPLPNHLVKVGVPFSYTLPEGTFTDPDGDPLSYTVAFPKTVPDWLNWDSTTLTFDGTPTVTGSWKVRITATSIDGTVSGEFTMATTGNLPPTYNGGIPTELVWTTGLPYYYQFGENSFTDYEGDPITYEAWMPDSVPISDFYPWINFDGAARTFSGSAAGEIADIPIQIRASDASRSTHVDVTIRVVRGWYIQASAGAHGSIAPSGSIHLAPGDSLSFTIAPETNYHIADVLVDGSSVGAVASHTFSNIAADHTIAASFAPNFLDAVVDIDPNTLNLKSQSDKNALTAYIELPAGNSVTDINVATVRLKVNGTEIPAQLTPTSVGDYDKDGVADRMVKFSRQAVISALTGKTGDISLTITGQLADGRQFSGTDTITVINPGK